MVMADDTQRDTDIAPSRMGRLLPWMTDDGKPCYLTSASAGGVISKMADAMEAEQIRTAREVLAESRLMLEEERLGRLELRFVSKRLTECLADALRVAESRGIRIGIEDPRPDDDMEELTDSGAGE